LGARVIPTRNNRSYTFPGRGRGDPGGWTGGQLDRTEWLGAPRVRDRGGGREKNDIRFKGFFIFLFIKIKTFQHTTCYITSLRLI